MDGTVYVTRRNVRFCRICHEEQPAPASDAEQLPVFRGVGAPFRSNNWGIAFFRGIILFVKHAHGGFLRLILGLVRRLKLLRKRVWRVSRESDADAKDTTRRCIDEGSDTTLRQETGQASNADELLGDPKTLIAPCRCSGTLKYVHQGCLRKWLRRQPDPNCWHCEICGHFYASQVQFRPAYEFLFRWPLHRDKAAGNEIDDTADEDWLMAFSDWSDPSLQVSMLNREWDAPAEASERRAPSFIAWLLRGWQTMIHGQRQDPVVASRWLHWLHIIYIGLFARHVFRQAQELAHLLKQTTTMDPLPRALYRGGHAVRTVVEANALVALRTALIAHYLIFLAVDVRFLYCQFKLWRSATARILILNYDGRDTAS
ncbi:hypothetical protein F1559_003053 [Cyanidiococcus yangmingshanensis]|uniref:RING-CH-type domain-containing protein n=1 Tax=Cyanidiococcus yangmingshanensis TaxID=2690220 RepID=A0A7J7IDZ2_9RHOD|nr:hypothetical protein F1559_003053 [Cyanidiococcus yangmingshanensis]